MKHHETVQNLCLRHASTSFDILRPLFPGDLQSWGCLRVHRHHPLHPAAPLPDTGSAPVSPGFTGSTDFHRVSPSFTAMKDLKLQRVHRLQLFLDFVSAASHTWKTPSTFLDPFESFRIEVSKMNF